MVWIATLRHTDSLAVIEFGCTVESDNICDTNLSQSDVERVIVEILFVKGSHEVNSFSGSEGGESARFFLFWTILWVIETHLALNTHT